jgi:hypothetical protein
MSPEDFCRRAYCAIAHSVAFDPVTGRLALAGTVHDQSTATSITIVATGVTGFEWQGAVKDPDGLFELSTVEITASNGGWELEFHPWFTARVRLRCESLQLDGETVEGTGSWFQDDLHGPRQTDAPDAAG